MGILNGDHYEIKTKSRAKNRVSSGWLELKIEWWKRSDFVDCIAILADYILPEEYDGCVEIEGIELNSDEILFDSELPDDFVSSEFEGYDPQTMESLFAAPISVDGEF